jgi:hypothetical protein
MKSSLVLPLLVLGAAGNVSIAMAQSAGTFTATGNMTTPRVWHTATLLPDGHVLIAGGVAATGGQNGNLASAELFDPLTGAFSPTGNLTVARSQHTATLLANGKVLIAGGGNTPVSAELYDPATGTFTATGRLIADGDFLHTATLLPDGRVLLVALGFSQLYSGPGAQVYDPSTGVFAPTGSPYTAPYGDSSATSLPDGSVLITQGNEIRAEVYDPRTSAFSLTAWPRIPWVQGSATLLLNGKVLLAGGNDETGQTESSLAEVYDPSTQIFDHAGSMTEARAHHTATLLPDGTILIAGSDGAPFGDFDFSLASAELYDPATSTFTRTGDMNAYRGLHTATLLNNGKVLIAGGLREDVSQGWVALSSAELYTPASVISAPVLFSLSGDGRGQGAVWDAATGQITSSQNPAVAGDVLATYTTSLFEGGVIPPQVAIGGQLAEVLYFGDAPGYPRYFQVNFRVPNGVALGSAVPVRLTYIGRPSNAVTIGVH